MFETLFTYPRVLRGHREGPLAEERAAYLSELAAQCVAPATLIKQARCCLRVAVELARMLRIGHDDGVVREMPGEFMADAFGPDRHGVGFQETSVVLPPRSDDPARTGDPIGAAAGRLAAGMIQHPVERQLRIGIHRSLERVVEAEGLGFDIDLDRRRADRRHLPEMRGHAAGLGADEADEVGLADDPVGALAGIGTDDAHRERVVAGDRIFAVEGCRDGDGKALGERHELRSRARYANAAAGYEDRPLGTLTRR